MEKNLQTLIMNKMEPIKITYNLTVTSINFVSTKPAELRTSFFFVAVITFL